MGKGETRFIPSQDPERFRDRVVQSEVLGRKALLTWSSYLVLGQGLCHTLTRLTVHFLCALRCHIGSCEEWKILSLFIKSSRSYWSHDIVAWKNIAPNCPQREAELMPSTSETDEGSQKWLVLEPRGNSRNPTGLLTKGAASVTLQEKEYSIV